MNLTSQHQIYQVSVKDWSISPSDWVLFLRQVESLSVIEEEEHDQNRMSFPSSWISAQGVHQSVPYFRVLQLALAKSFLSKKMCLEVIKTAAEASFNKRDRRLATRLLCLALGDSALASVSSDASV